MGREFNKIITISTAAFILGLGFYLNRKKIKMIFAKRVSKIDGKDMGFIKALAKECRRRQRQAIIAPKTGEVKP